MINRPGQVHNIVFKGHLNKLTLIVSHHNVQQSNICQQWSTNYFYEFHWCADQGFLNSLIKKGHMKYILKTINRLTDALQGFDSLLFHTDEGCPTKVCDRNMTVSINLMLKVCVIICIAWQIIVWQILSALELHN